MDCKYSISFKSLFIFLFFGGFLYDSQFKWPGVKW